MAGSAPAGGWTLSDAPRLDGKAAIVTGATGGLGYETALGLASRGATTILAGRNPDKGARALANILREVPGAKVRFAMLDLASLASVARFADTIAAAQGGVIDILVSNAGFMGSPMRLLTEDRFERQIGVNYLAHFALTARLKRALCAAQGGGRVVSVASLAHRRARLNLDDLQSEAAYRPMGAYAQSKLAMLVFAIELQRRAERNGWNLRSVAAHPGWARTDLIANGMGSGGARIRPWLIGIGFRLVAQSARDGALPLLYAATSPEAKGGGYYGPGRFGETRGAPAPSWIAPQAADRAVAERLRPLSEQLTGVAFETGAPLTA
jgi:NAD(P)-dependent dehydrogenase (short-subunit alcohol dehydrogenase family)